MEIVRHVHGTWRMIRDFYEKAILLKWKSSAVTATSLAFDRLMKSNKVIGSWQKGSSRFIYYGEQIAMVGKNCLPRDFDNFFQKKMLNEFRSFLIHWRPLAAKLSELLVSNWCDLVPLLKQFKRAKEVFNIRCHYVDITSRTWYLAEDRRFLWKGEFAGKKKHRLLQLHTSCSTD